MGTEFGVSGKGVESEHKTWDKAIPILPPMAP